MKRKVVRPEPHKLSTYFFDQLLQRSPPLSDTSPEEGGQKDGAHRDGEGPLPRFSCLGSKASALGELGTAEEGQLFVPPPPLSASRTSVPPRQTDDTMPLEPPPLHRGREVAAASSSSAQEEDVGKEAEKTCPGATIKTPQESTSVGPDGTPPPTAIPVAKAIPNDPLSPYWSLASVTRDKATDGVLWNTFTPHTYQTELVDFISQEHHRTRSLAMNLDVQWEKVQELLARNVARRRFFSPDFEQQEVWKQLQEELQSMPFWSSDAVVQRYGLDLTLPSQREKEKTRSYTEKGSSPSEGECLSLQGKREAVPARPLPAVPQGGACLPARPAPGTNIAWERHETKKKNERVAAGQPMQSTHNPPRLGTTAKGKKGCPAEEENPACHASSSSSTIENTTEAGPTSFFQQSAQQAHIHLQFDMSCGRDERPSTIPTTEENATTVPRHPSSTATTMREGTADECSRNSSSSSRSRSNSTSSTSSTSRNRNRRRHSVEGMEQTSRSTVKGSTNAMGKAYRMPNAELLNPSKRPRCLRRLFAPLLQKQEQLPKNLTLLLAEVRKCQAKMLPSLEELLQDCSMFHIPLHLPFQMIAHFIQRYLTKERSTVAMVASQAEEKLVEAMKRESPALQSFLRAHGQEEDPLDRLPTVERHRLAQEMWKSILASLTQHRDRHHTFLQDFSHLTTTSQSELHTMTHALADCTEASSVAMGQLEQDAKECVEVIKGMTMKTLRTVEEIRSEFRTEEDALRASLDRKLYRLQRSEAEQERLARRAREAVKAWMNEQLQYEETAQEVFQERLALAQLQTSYTQLQRSLQTCYAEALATDKRATQIRRMLKKSEKARQFLLTACRQHVGRLETEEYYQRRVVADRCCQNVQSLACLLHDAVSVYEDRFDGVLAKTDRVSWQMQFLLSSERDFVVGNLLDAKEAWNYLEERWNEVKALYKTLDLDDDAIPPLLDEGHITSSDAEALRKCMKHLDGPLNVQRQVPRLREWLGIPESSADRIASMKNEEVRQLLDYRTPTGLPLSSKTKARLMALALSSSSSSSTSLSSRWEAGTRHGPLNAAGMEDDGVAGKSMDERVEHALPSPRPSSHPSTTAEARSGRKKKKGEEEKEDEGEAGMERQPRGTAVSPHARERKGKAKREVGTTVPPFFSRQTPCTSAHPVLPTPTCSTGEEKSRERKGSRRSGPPSVAVPEARFTPSYGILKPSSCTTSVDRTGGTDSGMYLAEVLTKDDTHEKNETGRQKKCLTDLTVPPIPPTRQVYAEGRSVPNGTRDSGRSSSSRSSSSSRTSDFGDTSMGNHSGSRPTSLQQSRQAKENANDGGGGGGEEEAQSKAWVDNGSPTFIAATRVFSPFIHPVPSSSSSSSSSIPAATTVPHPTVDASSPHSSAPSSNAVDRWRAEGTLSLSGSRAKIDPTEKGVSLGGPSSPTPLPRRPAGAASSSLSPIVSDATSSHPTATRPGVQKGSVLSSSSATRRALPETKGSKRAGRRGSGGGGTGGAAERKKSPSRPFQDLPRGDPLYFPPTASTAILLAKTPSRTTTTTEADSRSPVPSSSSSTRTLAPLRRISGTLSSSLQLPSPQSDRLYSPSSPDRHCAQHFGGEERRGVGGVAQRRTSSSNVQGERRKSDPLGVEKANREDEKPPLTVGLD